MFLGKLPLNNVKYFNGCSAKLVESFSSGISCVAITFDIWCGNDKEYYLCVVAHYFNSDWQLEKRVICLWLLMHPTLARTFFIM